VGVELSPREVNLYIKLMPWILLAALGYFSYTQIKANALLSSEIESINSVITTERGNAQDAANRQLARIIDEGNRDDELQKLRACVDAGTCGVRVRWKSCPVPSTAASGSGTSTPTTEPDRELASWYFSHRELINDYETTLKACQSELRARSDKKYCQPK